MVYPRYRSILFSAALMLLHLSPARADDDSNAGILHSALASVPEGDSQKTLSPYFFVSSKDGDTDDLPLKRTWADINIDGVIARVSLTQVYENEGKNVLEAIYIFPASTRAAVFAMRMQIGDRIVEARIRKTDQARQEYAQALEQGRTASLLEQKRPNVFMMRVGNILPGDQVRVELEYNELLEPNEGTYEFVLPTVVGPRYAGGSSQEANWLANPYLSQGEEASFTFGLQVMLQSPVPIQELSCPGQDAKIEFKGKTRARIDMEPGYENDRDFILRYRLAGGSIEQGIMLSSEEEEKTFLLMMQAPARIEPRQVSEREYIFVLDVSGSMRGFPLEVSKGLVDGLLKGLGPQDTFNIVLFSGSSYQLSAKPLAATPANIRRAKQVIDQQSGGGGTEILRALKTATALERGRKRARIFVIVTDGYVSVEDEVFRFIRSHLDQASFFSFGIGTSVNRHLIEGMARAGQAKAFVATSEQEAESLSRSFFTYVSKPVLHDVKLEFDGFDSYELEPSKPSDLFGDRPLLLMGKWRGEAKGRIIVRGQTARGSFKRALYVRDALDLGKDDSLQILWARKRIAFLADCLAWLRYGDATELEKQITQLGLKYKLLTKYTSFVAVDSEVRSAGEKRTPVKQPLPLPKGVSNSAIKSVAYQQAGSNQASSKGILGVLGTAGNGSASQGQGYLVLKGYGAGGVGSFGGLGIRGNSNGGMVSGSLSTASIKRRIRAFLPTMQKLYRKQLKSDPSLKGKISVRLTIASNGTVLKVKVIKTDIENEIFIEDLLKLLKKLKFPKTAGGGKVVVNYPFVFSP